jgi:hypothetical protein
MTPQVLLLDYVDLSSCFPHNCEQCCGSGMFIPDPRSCFLPISDPGSRSQKQQQRKRWKNFDVIPFFVATNFTKLKIILFEMLKKKIWANFVTKLSKIQYEFGIRYPRSGIREKPISEPGVKKAPYPRIRIRNTGCEGKSWLTLLAGLFHYWINREGLGSQYHLFLLQFSLAIPESSPYWS